MAKEKGVLRVGPAVCSFPDIFTPNEYNGKRKFQLYLIFKGGEKGKHAAALKAMKAAGQAAIKQAYPDGKVPKGFNIPFRDGEEKEDVAGYDPGDIFVKVWRHESDGRIAVVGTKRDPDTGELERLTPADIHPGCEVIVACKAFVYNHKESKNTGLAFKLMGVQKSGEGDERYGGDAPIDPDEVFDEIVVEEEESADSEVAF